MFSPSWLSQHPSPQPAPHPPQSQSQSCTQSASHATVQHVESSWQTQAWQPQPLQVGTAEGVQPLLHAPLLTNWQPAPGLHESVVQGLLSLQTCAGPVHTPFWQVSLAVQALASLHGALLFVNTQPVWGLHESSVQILPSVQLITNPGLHEPAVQRSPWVHALPSVHVLTLLTKVQPAAALQMSVVQGLESLHDTGLPLAQPPFWQTSPWVQALPSLQPAVLLANTHPTPGLHESLVHTLLSLHTTAAPAQIACTVQVSLWVQALLSLHG
jgi:hypothetical protein